MSPNQSNKQRVLAYWAAIDAASVDLMEDASSAHLPENFCWKGPAPLGEISGPSALAQCVLAPLKSAIPDLQRQTHLFLGGQSSDWVANHQIM